MALINKIYVCAKTETLSRESELSSHTLPIGSITDNVRAKNEKLEITGSIVDVENTKAADILAALVKLYNNNSNITFQGRHIFYSCTMTSFETKASASVAGGYDFTMELVQIKTSAIPYKKSTAGTAATGTAQIASTGAAEPVYHVVKSGDTLYSIAQQYYGDRNRFIDIYNANKSKIYADYTLTVGQRLLIP